MYVNDVLDDLLTEDQIIIRNHIGEDEVLAQMAEEAAELAQACLKLRRALMNVNPTPVSEQEAAAKLAEEFSDVVLCKELLGLHKPDPDSMRSWMTFKANRWAKRLREGKRE